MQRILIHIKSRSLCWMCPSAPRVCSEPGDQKPVLSLSLNRINLTSASNCYRSWWYRPKISKINPRSEKNEITPDAMYSTKMCCLWNWTLNIAIAPTRHHCTKVHYLRGACLLQLFNTNHRYPVNVSVKWKYYEPFPINLNAPSNKSGDYVCKCTVLGQVSTQFRCRRIL